MTETETKRKKRKKLQSIFLSEQEEGQAVDELVKVLEELEKEGKLVEIQICPKCKSPKVRRVKTTSGDVLSHMGILPPQFECQKCGWRARLVLKATNKRLSVRDVEIIAEASDIERQKQ
jgi:ribosomal protein L37AE/L43A